MDLRHQSLKSADYPEWNKLLINYENISSLHKQAQIPQICSNL